MALLANSITLPHNTGQTNATLSIICDYFIKRKIYEYAIGFFASIAYNDPKHVMYIAEILQRMGKEEKALVLMSKIIKSKPELTVLLF